MTEHQEEKSPEPDESPRDEGARLLEARALELQNHIQRFSADLKLLALSLEARKRETTILKIMFYTGVVVLMLAFFYSSNALHQAQLKSFEHNLDHLQTLTESNITNLQRGLMNDIQGLTLRVKDLEKGRANVFVQERRLEAALVAMNQAIAPLGSRSQEMSFAVETLQHASDELFDRYQNYASDNALPPEPSAPLQH